MIKFLMKMFQTFPSESNFENWEVFNHEIYLKNNEDKKKEIRRATCLARYNIEKDKKFSWMENYFLSNLNPDLLKNKTLLDLGSFTGGRLSAWYENYELKKVYGIDINPIFKIAADEFASEKKINAEFKTGVGEKLPYDNNSFDFIVSTDTFEHVQNLENTMNECFRLLSLLFYPLVFIKYLDELFIGRICVICKK